MADPREGKLPLWAQQQLETARTMAALSWPTEKEPICVPHEHIRENPGPYWKVTGGFGMNRRSARPVKIERHMRLEGFYYGTQREALVAAWWDEAHAAAGNLYRLREEIAQAEVEPTAG